MHTHENKLSLLPFSAPLLDVILGIAGVFSDWMPVEASTTLGSSEVTMDVFGLAAFSSDVICGTGESAVRLTPRRSRAGALAGFEDSLTDIFAAGGIICALMVEGFSAETSRLGFWMA